MAEEPPPSYDTVVAGTWHQDNTIPPNSCPYPSYPRPLYTVPVPSSNAGFNNDFLPSSHQSLPKLTIEAPPPYNEQVVEVEFRTISPTSANTAENTEINNDNTDNVGVCSSLVFFCVAAAIPIAMIYLGLSNLENCSETQIPIYSVVSGSLAANAMFFICVMICFPDGSFCYGLSLGSATVTLIAHFGVQCWGSYLVFRKWHHWKMDDFICDRSTYLLSFSTLIIYWCLGLCMCKFGKSSN